MGHGDASASDDGPSGLFVRDWSVPWHCHVLPAALVALIVGIWIGSDGSLEGWAVSRSSLRQSPTPLITHMLAHGGWTHVLVNGAVLLLLSGAIISRLGSPPISWLRYMYIIVGSAISGAALFLVFSHGESSMLGASGAVFGLIGTLARVHPSTGHAVPIRSHRTWAVLRFFVQNHLLLFFLLVVVAVLTGESALVAWQAHLGGLLFGFFIAPLFLRQALEDREIDDR